MIIVFPGNEHALVPEPLRLLIYCRTRLVRKYYIHSSIYNKVSL
uniref:Uncharacterized protein n=2 Tax=Anguilla anguilla TaxID=7936 RepID=A0A0E9PWA3_ANGAN